MHTGDALDDNFELSGDEEDDEEGSAEEGDSEGDDELNATDAKRAAQAAGDHPLQQSFQAAASELLKKYAVATDDAGGLMPSLWSCACRPQTRVVWRRPSWHSFSCPDWLQASRAGIMSRVRRTTRKESRRRKRQRMEVMAQQRQSLTRGVKMRVRIAPKLKLKLRPMLKVYPGGIRDGLWRSCSPSRGGFVSI